MMRATLLLLSFVLACSAVSAADYEPDIREFGQADDLDFPTDPVFALGDPSTLEMWVAAGWQADPGYDPVLLYHADPEGLLYVLAMLGDRSGLTLQVGDTLDELPYDFADERLHHVVLVNLTDSVALMVDGQVVGAFDLQIPTRQGTTFRVGSAPGPASAFAGAIGGLRIWSIAVQRDTLIAFALRDVFKDDHPDMDFLRAHSNLHSNTIDLIPEADE